MPFNNNTSQSGIYIIANLKSGNVYIGQAQNLRGRWRNHKAELRHNKHHNEHLQRAWNKYGEKAFKFQVLEYCPIDQLSERETHFITIYKQRGMCYNLTNGGDGARGHTVSIEARQKLSSIRKGTKMPPFTEEHRQNLSKALKGRKRSAEHNLRLSKALKGRTPPNKGIPHTEETKQKISNALRGEKHPNFGKHLSDEHKEHISSANKGKPVSEEHRRKISESRIGKKVKPFTDEHRRKIGEANKGRVISPETRKKMSESRKRIIAQQNKGDDDAT